MDADRIRLESVLRQPENAEVLERNLFLNSLLYAKGISWTRLFDDLEKVMPHNVRLVSIRPQATGQNEILLGHGGGSGIGRTCGPHADAAGALAGVRGDA